MSGWTKLREELRETEMTPKEWKALRFILGTRVFGADVQLPPHLNIEIPGVTQAGKPYLLTIPTDDQGEPARIVVDLKPDLSSPAFDKYVDFRAELAFKDKPAGTEQGGGDD